MMDKEAIKKVEKQLGINNKPMKWSVEDKKYMTGENGTFYVEIDTDGDDWEWRIYRHSEMQFGSDEVASGFAQTKAKAKREALKYLSK